MVIFIKLSGNLVTPGQNDCQARDLCWRPLPQPQKNQVTFSNHWPLCGRLCATKSWYSKRDVIRVSSHVCGDKPHFSQGNINQRKLYLYCTKKLNMVVWLCSGDSQCFMCQHGMQENWHQWQEKWNWLSQHKKGELLRRQVGIWFSEEVDN